MHRFASFVHLWCVTSLSITFGANIILMVEKAGAHAPCIAISPVGPQTEPNKEKEGDKHVNVDECMDGLMILEAPEKKERRYCDKLHSKQEEYHLVESYEREGDVHCLWQARFLRMMAPRFCIAIQVVGVPRSKHVRIHEAEQKPYNQPS